MKKIIPNKSLPPAAYDAVSAPLCYSEVISDSAFQVLFFHTAQGIIIYTVRTQHLCPGLNASIVKISTSYVVVLFDIFIFKQ